MYDVHSPVLFGVDHGSPDEISTRHLLDQARDLGCQGVAFTPHFYCHRKSVEDFLQKRNSAYELFKNRLAVLFPDMRFTVGAEVAFESELLERLSPDELLSL